METVIDDWPYTDEPTACAACGSDDEKYVVVDSLGLVWGAAMRGGPSPTEVGDYGGTLEFRCCHDCWEGGVDALHEARSLVDWDARATGGAPFVLDDEKVAAAAQLDARRVAVGDLRPMEFRSDPEREHVRSQDEAVEAMLDAWFDD
ncbi:hypothetical protein [Halorussus sp. MSC15.2]|uniref:hypothetical protein n=1 Tax=Halorussus sp. MSC15.2 TaxID=2283638 RepID=UPI0013CFF687|nr:hypothetical protein [Halorussus sp. MSC15.2]NEU56801.1 hypothetical protein [Halorussus sp. MSC15.2]